MPDATIPPLRPPCALADFARADIRVGRVLAVEPFPRARQPAYKLTIDFGPLGVRRSSAQITAHYDAQSLVGRLVLAVVNFPPRNIAGFQSEVLTLGLPDAAGAIVLAQPERDVPLGSQLC